MVLRNLRCFDTTCYMRAGAGEGGGTSQDYIQQEEPMHAGEHEQRACGDSNDYAEPERNTPPPAPGHRVRTQVHTQQLS